MSVLLPATLIHPATQLVALLSLQPVCALSHPQAHIAPSYEKKKKKAGKL